MIIMSPRSLRIYTRVVHGRLSLAYASALWTTALRPWLSRMRARISARQWDLTKARDTT